MNKSKGSILIVVLLMIFILSFISIAMLNFTYFYFSDSSLAYERTKLKFATEYETFRLIKSLKLGKIITNLISTNTNTDNFIYSFQVKMTNYSNNYKYTLLLSGQKIKNLKREITCFLIYPTDFCYVNMSKVLIPQVSRGALWGYVFFNEIENKSPDFLIAFSHPPVFSKNTNSKINSFTGEAEISETEVSARINLKGKTNFIYPLDMTIDVDKILDKALEIAKGGWIIDRYSKDFGTEKIENPFIAEKEYLGTFRYSTPYLKVPTYIKVNNVYFSEVKRTYIDPLESSDVIGSRGEYSLLFITIKDGNLGFNTQPVEMKLPLESFEEPFKIKLNTPGTRITSKYRKITGIYLDDTDINLLFEKKVALRGETIFITDESIKSKYYLSLGKGNGIKKEFRLPRDTTPQIVFVGNKKIENVFVENFNLVLAHPPSSDEEVIVMKKIPKVYIQKSYPLEGTHIYTDKPEYAVVLDFDKINNLPKIPVIFSYLPLVIKGTPNEPIVIASKENIYVDEINTDPLKAKTMVIISRKGVFVKEHVEVLRNVFIVSRLDGIYRLSPLRMDDLSNERGMWIFGNVLLEGTLRNKLNGSIDNYYLVSPENVFNNKTIALSRRVIEDYLSNTKFGEIFRNIFPPFVVVKY
jgi:hypothetical protein